MYLSFSGMKVKIDTTTQRGYSLLFLLAILWTKEKNVQTFQLLAGDPKTPVILHTPFQGRDPYPSQVHPAVTLPHLHSWHGIVCVAWQTCGTASTPLYCALQPGHAKAGQRSGHSLAKDKKLQRNSGQKALKRLTEKKKNCINKTWSYLK